MSECLLAVILRHLSPCEVWGKTIVVLREDHRRRAGARGYTMSEIRVLLKNKHGVDYRAGDTDKMADSLVTLNVMEVVSTNDATVPHYDLSQHGVVWADAILEAARVHDERFVPYVRTNKLKAISW